MNNPEREEKWNKEFNEEWINLWLPLITTEGYIDEQKVKNELQDLVFIYKQVAEVYCYITGDLLSKPMYYADIIEDAFDDEVNRLVEKDRYGDRKRILKLIDNKIDYDSIISTEGDEVFSEEIKLYGEEIDDLISNIMEE